ncbi:SDR family oxidoreductase [Nocardiopsis coralliicola]
MTVLVTGATGKVGRHVVEGLVGRGVPVRALTRDPERARTLLPRGVDLVQGDLESTATLHGALAGVERMYLFPVAETARETVAMARAAGVRRITVLSSGAVTGGFDTTFHLPVEQAVEESGLEWTHIRPGEFAANKTELWGPSIRAERTVRDANPDAAWFPVHERDVADAAVAALLDDGHTGSAYTLNGPEMISLREQVEAISAAIGEKILLEKVTPHEAKRLYLLQGGFAAENADFLLGFTDYDGDPSDPEAAADFDPGYFAAQPTLEDALGVPARTFAQWARDHADDFR